MNRTRIALALAAVALVAGANTAAAQAPTVNGTITATANVAAALAVSGTNVDFGNVFQGIAKTVATADNTPGTRAAGKFTVVGNAGSQVSVTFGAMPSALTSGTNNLSAGSWTGCSNQANDGSVAGGCSAFGFAGATLANLSSSGYLYMFIGGTVTPTATQAAGTYANTISMTVAYTGN
jgi:hypothetical protein